LSPTYPKRLIEVDLPIKYLEQVWAGVAKEALSLVFSGADTAAFEPDARLTAMWLWTLNAGAPSPPAPLPEGEGSEEEDEDSGGKTNPKSGFTLE